VIADFLGHPAPFPQGPFVLAHLLECPVYLFFCLKEGERYRVHLEHFAERVILPRRERQSALAGYAQRYARRLEAYCQRAPLQWFNFFDFWQETSQTNRAPASLGSPHQKPGRHEH
jgi:predicted LPLAT superfamily acyltransferase